METIGRLLTDNFEIWTSAVERKSNGGRGRSKQFSLYGIEKLRALILELAVRGKLVPQNASDEPATELLKRIREERKRLLASGEIGKARDFNGRPSATPYVIPESWLWIQVSDVGHDWGQTTPSSTFTYIDVGSIDQRLGKVHDPEVLNANSAPSRARKRVREGTVIYSTVRPYLLNIAVINESFDPEPIASTAFAIVHPFAGVIASYVYHYLRSPPFVTYVEGCQTGIAYPAINDKQFFSAPFPLPPEDEQRRIVAKLDELMTLCDVLESGTNEAIEAHEMLVQNLLVTLTNSPDVDAFAENWTRIKTHFDTLFTTEASIDQLKQTIQQLAVSGRLEPQLLIDERSNQKKLRPDDKAESYDVKSFSTRSKKFLKPTNWTIEPLSRVSSHIVDCPHTTPRWTSEGYLCAKSEQVMPGYLDLSSPNFVSEETYVERIERLRPEPDDILFKREGGILGVACRIPEGIDLCLGQRLMLIRSNESVSAKFLELVLNSRWITEYAKEKTTGGAAPRVNMTIVRGFPIPLPPLAEQHRILERVSKLAKLCELLKLRLASARATEIAFADAVASRAVA